MNRELLLICVGAGAYLSLQGCGSFNDKSCTDYNTCGGDGGAGDANGGGTLFVSRQTGQDSYPGTKAQPFKSIAAALARRPSSVSVCEGTYPETITIAAGTEVVGGLDCTTWSPGKVTTIAPTIGIPLTITANDAVTLTDLAFTAADAGTPGGTSVGAFVANANVTFRRVKLTAGKGASATKGTTGTNYSGDAAEKGQVPTDANGGRGGIANCNDGSRSNGGKGGNGVATPVTDRNGAVGTSDPAAQTSADRDGSGGTGGVSSCQTNPKPGAEGAAKPGAKGAPTWGTLKVEGWQAQGGENGGNGEPGQGGGGGGAITSPGEGGGGGGAGGCGGAGGPGGAAGGSSFALLSFNSKVVFEASALKALDAGGGADGAQGGKGQSGGTFGAATCNGARGGNGAGGGGGGGGAGGLSVAIGYIGAVPTTDPGTTLEKGSAGALGKGGAEGDSGGSPGNKGNPGGDGKPGDAFTTRDLAAP